MHPSLSGEACNKGEFRTSPAQSPLLTIRASRKRREKKERLSGEGGPQTARVRTRWLSTPCRLWGARPSHRCQGCILHKRKEPITSPGEWAVKSLKRVLLLSAAI
ncbi:hypothetical protein MHYP_G00301130 [Metynnis hypsauchen]